MGKKGVQITLQCGEGGEGEENVCPLGRRLSTGENVNATLATFREFPGRLPASGISKRASLSRYVS